MPDRAREGILGTRRFAAAFAAVTLLGATACAQGSGDAADIEPDVPSAAGADSSAPTPVDAPADSAAAVAADAVPAEADVRWTSGDTRVEGVATGTAVLRAVRTARHEAFDRIVYEFESAVPGYRISYIDRPVRQCGSGNVVPFEGDAWLSMVFEPSDAHTQEGRPTVAERSRRLDLPNVIELKLICDYEAQVEWVAGVHAPMEYRVLTLREPDRLVVDIRHPAIREKPEEESP